MRRIEEINSRELKHLSVKVYCRISVSDKSGNLLDETETKEDIEFNSKIWKNWKRIHKFHKFSNQKISERIGELVIAQKYPETLC